MAISKHNFLNPPFPSIIFSPLNPEIYLKFSHSKSYAMYDSYLFSYLILYMNK